MKINDVEKLLDISKANIRFYEKEGLIKPTRFPNGYRDYTDAHIKQLQNIIILRKLGLSVQDIKQILEGTLPLQTAVKNNIVLLHQQIEMLTGSILLSEQIVQEQLSELDTQRYWDIIHSQEKNGKRFADYMEDVFYWYFTDDVKQRLLSKKYGPALYFLASVLEALVVYVFHRMLSPSNPQFSMRFAIVWFALSCIRPLILFSKSAQKQAKIIGTIVLFFVIIAAVVCLYGIFIMLGSLVYAC